MSDTVTVPSSAGRLVLLLGVSGQSPNDAAWFDDVRVYKLDS